MKYFIIVCAFFLLGHQSYAQSDVQQNHIKVEAKIKVFPNPATNVVNVLGLKNSSKAAITIFDIYGNQVLSRSWEIRRNAVNIPIASLEPGAYIISILSEEQKVRTKFYKK